MSHDLMPLDPSWVSWTERFGWHLREIPNLVAEILKHRDPTKAARYDRELVSGSGADGTPAPMNVDVVDDADELWRALLTLAYAVDGWFEQHASWDPKVGAMVQPDAMPEVTASMRGAVVVGVHPSTSEHDALWEAHDVVTWLERHASAIEHRPALAAAAVDLEPIVRRLRLRYLVERKSAGKPLRRRCTTCGEVAVIVEWAEMVLPTKPFGVGRCERCGQLYVELQ